MADTRTRARSVMVFATVAMLVAACSSSDDDTTDESGVETVDPSTEDPMTETTPPESEPLDTTPETSPPTTAPPTTDAPTTTEAPVTTAVPTTTVVQRPEGPAADVAGPVTGANAPFMGEPLTTDLGEAGYVEHEYVATGTATSYAPGEQPGDGMWSFTPDGEAPYATRILVRRPADPADFSGVVVLEWLNVSGGADANPEWASIHEEVIRQGHVWVGVSAQLIGVMGGPVRVRTNSPEASAAGVGLRALDPERYGDLSHPGDGFAFDIYTQVARAIRSGEGLDGLAPELLVSAGESQSAFALVTYYNGVQPLTEAFDGFFVHSRGGASLGIAAPGESADLAGSLGGSGPTTFRDDQRAPVMNVQTEGDVTGILGSYAGRQPDNERFRLWEVAGTAHFDQHLLGDSLQYMDCGYEINDGPLDVVAKAGFRSLIDWIEDDTAPPEAPRLELSDEAPPVIVRDEDGNAVGGIRTPPVDVPIATLTGAPGPDADLACILFGQTIPFSPERLAALYPSSDEYEQRYAESADATIDAGFVLADDRDGLLAYADPTVIPSSTGLG